MSKKIFKTIPLIALCAILLLLPMFGQKQGDRQVENERLNFKNLMKSNPNYFGTSPSSAFKAVKVMQYNLSYEELKCLGFYPSENRLEAVINTKLPFGYGGNLCSAGSNEFVRFFIDWNGDGDYQDEGEDAGVVGVNVHDIPYDDYQCLTTSKPISYSVSLIVNPPHHSCPKPYMVQVKAILSWNQEPTPGNPNYNSVYGNVLEKWIQIEPLKKLPIKAGKLLKSFENEFAGQKSIEIKKFLEPQYRVMESTDLEALYKDKDVPELRINLPKIVKMAESIKQQPEIKTKYALQPEWSKLIKYVDVLKLPQTNINFEELTCVAYDYNQSQLKATMIIKRPYGYNGELCKAEGSYEYVAFWVYVKNSPMNDCEWKYCGTAKVNVHDIPSIPARGLNYAVYQSVDFSAWQNTCEHPVILKVRGKLAWNQEPPADNPDFIPVFGNTKDAYVQVKAGPHIESSEQKPFIWSIGRMPVESIWGNVYTTLPSNPGKEGYADGPCAGPGGYVALESPFGGSMTISGTITNAPDNPTEDQKLRYKLQYRKSGAPIWNTITSSFWIWVRLNGVPSGSIYQEVDSDGYYKFQKDLKDPLSPMVEVQDDVLGYLYTPASDGDGLYEIRMLVKNPTTLVETASEIIKIMVDNTAPEVDLTLNKLSPTNDCDFEDDNNLIKGTFKGTDTHFSSYLLTLEPYTPSPATAFTHQALVGGPTYNYGDNPAYPTLAAPGVNAGTFILNSTSIGNCGYILKIHVWDRTIVNDHRYGNYNSRSVGFCNK